MKRKDAEKRARAFLAKHSIGYPNLDGGVDIPKEFVTDLANAMLACDAKGGSVPDIPDPPPPPPPKRTLDRDAKLDELLKWLKALGLHTVDMGAGPSDLERLVAEHRGYCTDCRGIGFSSNGLRTVTCSACNGTGKAKQGDAE